MRNKKLLLFVLAAAALMAAKPAEHKVHVCHVPQGNPENGQAIWIDASAWLPDCSGPGHHGPGCHGGDFEIVTEEDYLRCVGGGDGEPPDDGDGDGDGEEPGNGHAGNGRERPPAPIDTLLAVDPEVGLDGDGQPVQLAPGTCYTFLADTTLYMAMHGSTEAEVERDRQGRTIWAASFPAGGQFCHTELGSQDLFTWGSGYLRVYAQVGETYYRLPVNGLAPEVGVVAGQYMAVTPFLEFIGDANCLTTWRPLE